MKTPIALILSLAALPVAAQDTSAIADIIDEQMQAFEARDIDRAFSFASPSLQRMFGSAETFGHMVEHGYSTVWNNTSVSYLGLRQERGRWVQRVMIQDAEGAVVLFDYHMIENGDSWRIDAVTPVDVPAGMA